MSRRTQKQRTELSRRRVIEATVRCIQRGGVTNATVSRIAAEAGITWGTIQHQFGSKNGLFAAILEAAVTDLNDSLEAFETTGKSLRVVVDEFAEIVWRHYSQPMFRATVEILLNIGKDVEGFDARVKVVGLEVVANWRRTIRETGCGASDETIKIAGELLETSLSGFAMRVSQLQRERPSLRRRRQALGAAIVYILCAGD